ncbi:hypothetical protein MLD38_011489 [Melastoma candidum]|uniref:Uncharacterized protein n=1 Tax=Melastoma candidum TaxID=119954 RepID=A0ACB9RBK1_9MYRT|nr:hypothetical protein MLD38_011489 [Melastoma candidum]
MAAASAAFVLLSLLLVAVPTPSGATYCVCKSGVSDQLLQKAIDYACGSGADCSAILQNGACYSPNTVKNHCDYAVNSYFQKKGQVNGSCDFAGAATPSASVPAEATGCVYPASSQAPTTSTGTSTTVPTTTSTGINSTTPTYSLGPTSTTGTVYDPNSHNTVAKSIIALILPPMFSLLWGL